MCEIRKNPVRITEKRNPSSLNIDRLDTEKILQVINAEDALVAGAVKEVIPAVKEAVDIIVDRMKRGGRLIYTGAGTSGRLGILDAVECVPTFSIEQGRVIGILAGGTEAFFVARENLEDNYSRGREEIRQYNLKQNDCVVGITASGNTPFVLGAVEEANSRGAATIGLVCNTDSLLEKKVDVAICPVVGPEVIAGSTRMKAGTAQKLVLNMISTTVMIKLGKVYSNLMVDLKATNSKLRERARNIFCIITGADPDTAEDYLKKSEYQVKAAIVMYKLGVDREKALRLLEENGGILRRVIG